MIKLGLGRRRKVGGAADQPGQARRDGVEDLPDRIPRGDTFWVGREDRKVGGPIGRQFAGQHHLDLAGGLRVLALVSTNFFIQSSRKARAALADAVAEAIVNVSGTRNVRILRPAVEALGQADFLFAERIAMGGRSVLLVRRAVTDDAVDDDQGRLVLWRGGISSAPRRTPSCRWRRRRARTFQR